MNSKIYRVGVLLLLHIFLLGCSKEMDETLHLEGTWELVGLEDLRVNQANRISDHILFSTEDGVYKYDFNSFNEFGLQKKSIVNIVAITGEEFIAATYPIHGDSQDTTIFKTVNNGENWIPFMTNYGGDQNEYTSTLCMDSNPKNPSVIYTCVFGSIAKTINAGNSWEITYGEVWGTLGITYFIKSNENTIWAGGENATFQPTLMRSNDSGETWVNLQANLQIYEDVSFETEVRDIVNKEGASSQLLLGLTAGVFKSMDKGETWSSVFEGVGITSFTISSQNHEIVYASGINPNETLFFMATNNFGDTWETVELETVPAGLYVNDIVSALEEGKEVLYFATNKGVYAYTLEN